MKNKHHSMTKFLFIIAIIVLNNCASVRSPEGGSLDEIPPTLLGTKPAVLNNIKPEQKITIRFSEYLKESSIKSAINVYPMHTDKVKYEFKGDKIDVWLPNNLQNDTTYMIVLDTSFSDEHGVTIEKDISIPFSMDSIFTSSTIEGNVYGDSDQSTLLLWRGLLNHDDMRSTDPDYIANTTSDSEYIFNYLPADDFSILAVEQYGSNIDYSKGQYALYHESLLSTKKANLKNIDFFIHKASESEELDTDSLDVAPDSNSDMVKTADISGTVTGKFLHPIKMLLQNSLYSYVEAVNLDGSYVINDVIGGKYQLLIYEDRNNSNRLDTGSFVEKEQSEEFYVYPDSLSCRANWELELPSWNYQKETTQ